MVPSSFECSFLIDRALALPIYFLNFFLFHSCVWYGCGSLFLFSRVEEQLV